MTPRRINCYLAVLLAGHLLLLIGHIAFEGLGRDLAQWYAAGRLVLQNDVARLYDQAYFQQVSAEFGEGISYYSLYPPAMALAFAPLAALEYRTVLGLWLLLQIGGLVLLVWRLTREFTASSGWRWTCGLAVLSFWPLLDNLWLGQLGLFWLAIFCAGFALQHRDQPFASGVVLSLLTLKPSLAAGVGFWLLLRIRTQPRELLGFVAGALSQATLTAVVLGGNPVIEYIRQLPDLFSLVHSYHYSPAYEHGFGGILANTLGPPRQGIAKLGHLIFAAVVTGLFIRIVRPIRRQPAPGGEAKRTLFREQSAAVCFALALAPHLLTYDLAPLLLPIFWTQWVRSHDEDDAESSAGSMLYLAAMLAPLYLLTRMSLVPIALLLALHQFAVRRDVE